MRAQDSLSMPEAKCPIEGHTQTFTAATELDAKMKLIAHVVSKHTKM